MVLDESDVCACDACDNRNLWMYSNFLPLLVQMVLGTEACQHTDA